MKKADVKSFPMRDTVLSSLEAEEKEYRIHDGNNLHFVVNPKGNKRWELRYKKPDGKWSWLGVGTYPELSGAAARKKAKEFIKDISNGDNPIIAKQARKQKDLEENNASFEVLAREWLTAIRKITVVNL